MASDWLLRVFVSRCVLFGFAHFIGLHFCLLCTQMFAAKVKTNSLEQSSSSEATCRLLWNSKIAEFTPRSKFHWLYLRQISPVDTLITFSKISTLILSSRLRLRIPNGPFPSGFPTKLSYEFICPIRNWAEALTRGSRRLEPSDSAPVLQYGGGPSSDFLDKILGVDYPLFLCNTVLFSTFFTVTLQVP
jgi:hypothetical protein